MKIKKYNSNSVPFLMSLDLGMQFENMRIGFADPVGGYNLKNQKLPCNFIFFIRIEIILIRIGSPTKKGGLRRSGWRGPYIKIKPIASQLIFFFRNREASFRFLLQKIFSGFILLWRISDSNR